MDSAPTCYRSSQATPPHLPGFSILLPKPLRYYCQTIPKKKKKMTFSSFISPFFSASSYCISFILVGPSLVVQ